MLENFKKLKAGKTKDVDPKLVYPLLRWCSGSQEDLPWCEEINNIFFSVDRDLACDLLGLGIQDKNPFMKYPKAPKIKRTKAEEVKRSTLMEYYGWSEQELNRNPGAIDRADWETVATRLGVDDKIRKSLGLPVKKTKRRKKATKKVTGRKVD